MHIYAFIHTHSQILFSYKNKDINRTICDNLDGTGGNYAKLNKPEKERLLPSDFIQAWNIKKQYQGTG